MLTEPNKHTWLGQDDLLDVISVMMLTLLNGVEAVAVSLDGVQM